VGRQDAEAVLELGRGVEPAGYVDVFSGGASSSADDD